MRFTRLCAVTIAATPVIASVCKPRATSSSTVSVDVIIPTSTSHEVGATTSATTDLPSAITTSSTELESEAVTSAISSYTETTSAESISIATTATTEAAWAPLATFNVVAEGSQVDGQLLTGYASAGSFVGWQIQEPQSPIALSETSSGYLQDSNGNTLCVQYGFSSNPNYLSTCDANSFRSPNYAPVTCEQTRDRRLECSVPAKACALNFATLSITCETLPGDFTAFYTYSGRSDGIWLVVRAATGPAAGNDYQSVTLGITEL
ncbi:pyruvate decarboxylase [Fusarium heterosporum]|uniref:Pyruvate decarboxylase n=1 Tax=Fusarium heterosporum TaxID=42747 RepID=A0A8H5WK78_FUSHE|nr:pyruvate decarboxylase [Fusarium heterosporum]